MYVAVRIICIVAYMAGFAAKDDGIGSQFTSFAGFELGSSTLADVQKELGSAKMIETGDAGEYVASVCYDVSGGIVLFLAGEIDGHEHNLGGFGIALKTDRKPCSKWPTSHPIPTLVIGGLRLGMSVDEFTHAVGGPIRMEGEKAFVNFESKRKVTSEEIKRLPKDVPKMVATGDQQNYFDIFISVTATFNRGRLQEFRIWKAKTL